MKFSSRSCRVFTLLTVVGAFSSGFAQEQTTAESPQSPPSEQENGTDQTPPAPVTPSKEQEPPGGKRAFGFLPNFRTADASEEGTPISAGRKVYIARRDSFDYPLVFLASVFAGIGQLRNQQPSFGQGLKGYGHRLLTNYADQAMGNMFTEGLFPAMLHEDPRYFRRGKGSVSYRAGYALTRIFVTKTDSGRSRFNFSEWLGNASSVAISNSYYPDTRNFKDNATKLLTQCGADALSQLLKEFWPDIQRKFFPQGKRRH